jgi:hypothetical protein
MNNKWLSAAGFFLVLLLLFFLYRKYKVAPVIDFKQLPLVDLNNKMMEAGTRGSARIITFGASWCSSCVLLLHTRTQRPEKYQQHYTEGC